VPTFTVIIATRDRPVLFERALNSVLGQTETDLDLIVVNDGSAPEHLDAYRRLEDRIAERGQSIHLVRRPNGHGQSYALNLGASHATSEFLCFLDDDDEWTDPTYLARVKRALAQAPHSIDLHLSNQAAFVGERRLSGPIWVEGLEERLPPSRRQPDENGGYTVIIPDLIGHTGFCHINCLIVRRTLWETIQGMDETIRWECDRDLFLRLIARAQVIRYDPAVVSRHNVPDPAKAASMTTMLPMLSKRLFQVRVLDKAMALSEHAEIRAHGRQHKGYALKKIAEDLSAARQWTAAFAYAREALGLSPTLKWALYTGWLGLRALRPEVRS